VPDSLPPPPDSPPPPPPPPRTAVAGFDYDLPDASIAQVPAPERSAARLLVAIGAEIAHRTVADLPELLDDGDVLVLNDTRVLPARLRLAKATGGAAEVLLVEETAQPDRWVALVRPGRRLPPGTVLHTDGVPVVAVGDDLGDGRRLVTLLTGDVAGAGGQIAMPPYIRSPERIDPQRYQTVYSRREGSVAAPTAGLHLTQALLKECESRGVVVATVDLAVGLDTFRPMTGALVEDHVMHSEHYRVPAETVDACRRARRVVAVGTTTVRALEAAAATGEREGRTDLFIRPGFRFQVVDVLLTNFHLPRSSLLVLLAAFCGDRWRELYRTALDEGYRFLSFGDAMLVGRA
jgi:S-adenosylmethionine:tRNA ribosyltransferase-isomerase